MNNKLSKIIGARINTLLANQGKRQKDLAVALEVTDNTISYFVSGSRIPNTEQLKKIAEFFSVSADYLLGLTDAKTTDKDLRFVCDYTGLSEESIKIIKSRINGKCVIEVLNGILNNGQGSLFFVRLAQEFWAYKKTMREYLLLLDDYTSKEKKEKEKDIDHKTASKFMKKAEKLQDELSFKKFIVQNLAAELVSVYCEKEELRVKQIKENYSDFLDEVFTVNMVNMLCGAESYLDDSEREEIVDLLKKFSDSALKDGEQNADNSETQ